MAFGFPASHEANFLTDANPSTDLHAAVRATLQCLGWPIKSETSRRMSAMASISNLSWGEQIVVDFQPGGSLGIKSQCLFPLQCLDWGKNKANVERFIAEIGRILPPESAKRAQ